MKKDYLPADSCCNDESLHDHSVRKRAQRIVQAINKHCRFSVLATMLLFMAIFLQEAKTQTRQMEYLNRALVAMESNDNILLTWRIFATDSADVSFNIYRNGSIVNEDSITGKSNYVDTTGTVDDIYHLETVVNDTISEYSTAVLPWDREYLTLPLQTPENYTPNDCSVADLDGDGEYEIIVKMEGATRDNSQTGVTDPVFLHAYKLNGTFLWSIDLGINIRGGAHYTQFMVYDLDGDGKAEVACKTAPGTMDGTGEYLSEGPAASADHNADYRNSGGFILSGPEYLTVFDGETGAEITTVDYVPPRGNLSDWGDDWGNRSDRFLACVAYFGSQPSLVMCRGYYTRSVLAAWDFDGTDLTQRWVFDSDDGYQGYEEQGAHSLSVGDADGDGKDEIMYGAMAIDHDGSPMYNTQFNHGDATHFGDLIPSEPGLEFYMPSESAGSDHDGPVNPAVHVRNGGSGDVIWSIEGSGDIGRAMTADITADHPGNEFWASSGFGVYNSSGEVISSDFPPINFAAWWDGDLLREMLDGNRVSKWGSGTLLTASGASSNNGTKATPAISGDIMGDWREEVVLRASDNQSLRIYHTPYTTDHGMYTLVQDPMYRLALTWQNVAYNQPPHPSFFIGHNMDAPPVPDISILNPDSITRISVNYPVNQTEFDKGLDVPVIIHTKGISDTNSTVFLADSGVIFDTITEPPYYLQLSGLESGDYSLTALCYDKSDELTESAPITFTVDEGYPHVNFIEPENNAIFTPDEDTINISVEANDTDGQVDSVLLYLDNDLLEKLTEEPYTYVLENPGIGFYEIRAVVYDDDQQATEAFINIDVGEVLTIEEDDINGFCDFTDEGGAVESNHEGYTGEGFANTENALNAGIVYGLNVFEEGNYTMAFRYALESGNRPGRIIINDTLESETFDFPGTGAWTTWGTVEKTVYIPRGTLKVEIRANVEGGLPNIDFMKIVANETDFAPQRLSCSSLPEPETNSVSPVTRQNSLKIYPMPAKSHVNVQLKDGSDQMNSIEIYSLEGSLVYKQENLNENTVSINVEAFSNNMYLMVVTTHDKTLVEKFTIK